MKKKNNFTSAWNSAKRRNGNQHLCFGSRDPFWREINELVEKVYWCWCLDIELTTQQCTLLFAYGVRVAMLTLRFTTHIVSHLFYAPHKHNPIHFEAISCSKFRPKSIAVLFVPQHTHHPIWIYEIHSLFRLNGGRLWTNVLYICRNASAHTCSFIAIFELHLIRSAVLYCALCTHHWNYAVPMKFECVWMLKYEHEHTSILIVWRVHFFSSGPPSANAQTFRLREF